ncbi:MAG: nucleotidyltransferase domain-containing protein [Promethearchaeota archaeon]
MKKEVQIELNSFIKKIEKTIEIACAILFGSQARGDYTQISDIDLIIIADFKEDFFNRILNLTRLNESGYNFELFCYTETEFKKMFERGNAFILDSINDGIPLVGESFFTCYKERLNQLFQRGLKKSKCTWILV